MIREGLIALHVSIRIRVDEMEHWPPEQIRALFDGIAQVRIAANGPARPASATEPAEPCNEHIEGCIAPGFHRTHIYARPVPATEEPKRRFFNGEPTRDCRRCGRPITDDDYEHGPGLCSAPAPTAPLTKEGAMNKCLECGGPTSDPPGDCAPNDCGVHPAGCVFGGFSYGYWLVAQGCAFEHPNEHAAAEETPST